MNWKSWIAPSLVTILSLGVGYVAAFELFQKTEARAFSANRIIPDCNAATTDFARGDIPIPEHEATQVDLDRVVCFGDFLRWHDQQKRSFTIQFTSTDCTNSSSPVPPNMSNSAETVTRIPVVQHTTSNILRCKYTLTVPGFANAIDPHIIVIGGR